ncbi:universal stress protein [Microbaculum sp. FT89]|uniref:universal stress protein n=1 Tax=Microbaculum sp. FT89 TaxID=3447298 RepID=UPI003F530A00
MAFKDILVHLDSEAGSGAGARRQAFAISLAATHDAHLTGLIFALEPTIPPMIMGEVPGSLLESQRTRALEAAQASADTFTEAANRAGIKSEVRIVNCTEAAAGPTLAMHGRTSDLILVGQPEPDDVLAIRELLVEAALFESGRATLVVPYIGPNEAKLDRVMVAWDGRRQASRAANEAMPVLKTAEAVSVVIVGDSVPSAHGGEPGADLALHLARHGLSVDVKRIGSAGIDVGNALLSHAADSEADLLVMGGYGHSRFREFMFGGTTNSILESMTIPVLMAH